MAKKQNYSKMYPKENETKIEPVDEVVEVVEAAETETVIEEPVATVEQTVPIFGIVSGCTKLNVRTKPNPNADVAYVVSADTKLNIDLDKSTNDWYHVSNAAGIEGFCMKNYIFIQE